MWKHVSEDFWKENRASKVGEVADTVRGIIDEVRVGGDKALLELTKKFDKQDLKYLEVRKPFHD